MNYIWLFITSLTSLTFSNGVKATEKNKTTRKLNTKSPKDRLQAKKTLQGSWIENARRQMSSDPEAPDPERGPLRGPYYDPNYGHEPYWVEGDWIYSTPELTTPKHSVFRPTPSAGTNCGLKCGDVYVTYGSVCGRTKDFKYKSFKNYCAMKSEDCSGAEEWRALYNGECRKATVFYRTSVRVRPIDFIDKFKTDFPNTFPFVATNFGYPVPFTEGYDDDR